MASKLNIHYSHLVVDEDGDYDGSGQNQHDPRFDHTPRNYDKVPWKSIFLAIFLLLLWCMLLLLAVFIFTGHVGGELSQAYSLLGLGLLTFVPASCTGKIYMVVESIVWPSDVASAGIWFSGFLFCSAVEKINPTVSFMI